MPILNVSGFGDVAVEQEGANKSVVEHGDVARSFSGKMRSDVQADSDYGVWRIRTAYLSWTDANSLIAALRATPPVSVSGDIIGGTVPCYPRGAQLNFGRTTETGTVTFELHQESPS